MNNPFEGKATSKAVVRGRFADHEDRGCECAHWGARLEDLIDDRPDDEFLLDLHDQYEREGHFTVKQAEVIERRSER